MNVRELVNISRQDFRTYVERVVTDRASTVPLILLRLTTVVVPNMMKYAGKATGFTGRERRQMVEEAVIALVDAVFSELNAALFSKETWDEHVRDVIKCLVPSIIDLLIDVEKGSIRFNKKAFVCC